MNSRSRVDNPIVRGKIALAEHELASVRKFLHQLRHNRGRWKVKWVKGMVRHYEEREAHLKGAISRHRRELKK